MGQFITVISVSPLKISAKQKRKTALVKSIHKHIKNDCGSIFQQFFVLTNFIHGIKLFMTVFFLLSLLNDGMSTEVELGISRDESNGEFYTYMNKKVFAVWQVSFWWWWVNSL